MSLISRFLSTSRYKSASRRVALDPSARNYLALAGESVVRGDHARVEATCEEALALHPDNPELIQMVRRAARIRLSARSRQLEKDLLVAPRPALWTELIEVHLEAERFSRASQVARRWRKAGGAGEALHHESRAALGAFLAGGVLEDGQVAWSLGQRAASAKPTDSRPLETLIVLCGRVGAHAERRTLLARLLELRPGQSELEAAFRESLAQSADAPGIQRALLDFTRRGGLHEDTSRPSPSALGRGSSVRSLLKALAKDQKVRLATYQQGGTALVQGLTGPSADRTARAVRDCARKTRELSVRIGLGRWEALSVEGADEVLLMSSGKLGLASLWCQEHPSEEQVDALDFLAQQVGGPQ